MFQPRQTPCDTILYAETLLPGNMTRRAFLIYTGLLIALAVAGTIVHGRLTNRWGGSTAQRQAAAKTLQLAPRTFGDWELQSETELSDRVKGILNCAGSLNRKYVNRATGQVVSVAMIVGPPGPTSSHVAEMCYSSQGLEQMGQRLRFQLELPGNQQHEFAEDNFQSPDVSRRRLQVCYAWRQDDGWCVPTLPRAAFGGHPFLYKIQVAAYYSGAEIGTGEDPCRAFLAEFLPALERTVFDRSVQ